MVRARRVGGVFDFEGSGFYFSRRVSVFIFIVLRGLFYFLIRACVRFFGSCFKTGRVGCRYCRRFLMFFLRESVFVLAMRRGWGVLRIVRFGR